MDKKIFFKQSDFQKASNLVDKSSSGIYNFLNMYSVYSLKKETVFGAAVSRSTNFIDGALPSLFLSLISLKKVNRLSGPVFTRQFLESSFSKGKKIMFVGNCNQQDLRKVAQRFKLPLKNLSFYNRLPYIAPRVEFARKDILDLSKKIKVRKVDYCFVCVGNPRQEILSWELEKLYKTRYLSVGAAWDFILGRKKEAPRIIRELCLEWLYRLVTDFKYSKIKVWRSFVGLVYLPFVVRLAK